MGGVEVLFSLIALGALGHGDFDDAPACVAGEAGTSGGCQNGDCCLGCQRVFESKTLKKTVYRCQLVPFCLPGCKSPLQCGQTCCESCEARPRWKRVLLKKEIVVGHTCESKCEVMCHTHGGAVGGNCAPAAPPAGGPPPAPAAYDAEPAPVPAAR